jgi:hypothetical protein
VVVGPRFVEEETEDFDSTTPAVDAAADDKTQKEIARFPSTAVRVVAIVVDADEHGRDAHLGGEALDGPQCSDNGVAILHEKENILNQPQP